MTALRVTGAILVIMAFMTLAQLVGAVVVSVVAMVVIKLFNASADTSILAGVGKQAFGIGWALVGYAVFYGLGYLHGSDLPTHGT